MDPNSKPPPYSQHEGAPPYPPIHGGSPYAPPEGYPPQGPPGQYPGPPGQYPGPGQYPPGTVYQQAPGYPPYQTITVQPVEQQVIVVGGCPACRVGVLEDDFTCCGIMMAICFFPIGILCCFAMKQRRCPNCGAMYG